MNKLLTDAIATAKREIIEDINNEVVPASVKSFSELHDYVDANTYGTVCDDKVRDLFPTAGEWYAFVDNLQNAINAWIQSGELKADLKAVNA